MAYDGPSYYRKKESHQNKKDRAYFDETSIRKNRPSRSNDYSTPSPKKSQPETITQANDNKKRQQSFRTKYIPPSLQKLDGWRKTEWTPELFAELKKRLFKTDESYLLFESAITKVKHPKEATEKTVAEKIHRIQVDQKRALKEPVRTLNNRWTNRLLRFHKKDK